MTTADLVVSLSSYKQVAKQMIFLLDSASRSMDSRGWCTRETRCLIGIWSKEPIQPMLEDSYRNRSIFEEISKQMGEKGYRCSWKQCQRRIKHLKLIYRMTKNSGRDKVTCPFYNELDMVLKDIPLLCPGSSQVLDTELDSSQDNESVNSSGFAETKTDNGDCDGMYQV